jgi:SH3-like domain-containing protein
MRMRREGLLLQGWKWVVMATIALIISAMQSCVSDQKAATAPEQLPEPEPMDSLDIPIDRVAICVYDPVGLRREPGNQKTAKDGKNNYIVPIRYGEKVEMVLDTPEVEVKGKNYMFVRLLDGQEGWVHDYVFEKHGRLAVMTEAAEIHRRPDLMTLRDDRFMPGEIVVVIENPENPGKYGEWLHVSYRDKKKKGWIKRKKNLTFAKRDVQVALLYFKALQDENLQSRLNQLERIASRDVAQNSVMRPFILNEIDTLKVAVDPNYVPPADEAPPAEDKLFITQRGTSLHSEPIDYQNKGIAELSAGDVCTIIDRGERMAIEDMNDYWYHVRFEDLEGWVYGYFTSKRVLE